MNLNKLAVEVWKTMPSSWTHNAKDGIGIIESALKKAFAAGKQSGRRHLKPKVKRAD